MLLSADTCLSRDGFVMCRFCPSQLLPADWEEGGQARMVHKKVCDLDDCLFRLGQAELPGSDVGDIVSG
jgi:hypothetical protein